MLKDKIVFCAMLICFFLRGKKTQLIVNLKHNSFCAVEKKKLFTFCTMFLKTITVGSLILCDCVVYNYDY